MQINFSTNVSISLLFFSNSMSEWKAHRVIINFVEVVERVKGEARWWIQVLVFADKSLKLLLVLYESFHLLEWQIAFHTETNRRKRWGKFCNYIICRSIKTILRHCREMYEHSNCFLLIALLARLTRKATWLSSSSCDRRHEKRKLSIPLTLIERESSSETCSHYT